MKINSSCSRSLSFIAQNNIISQNNIILQNYIKINSLLHFNIFFSFQLRKGVEAPDGATNT